MNLSLLGKKLLQFPVLFVCGIVLPLLVILLIMRGPKVAQYDAEMDKLEREWTNIQTNIERSTGLREDIDLLEAGLEEIQGRLMRVEEVAVNHEFFYAMERQTGIILRQFSQGSATLGQDLPMGGEGMRNFSSIPYNFVMEGTLEQILTFIELLDRQPYIVRLDSLNISRPAETTQSGEHLLSGRLRCHVLAAKHE